MFRTLRCRLDTDTDRDISLLDRSTEERVPAVTGQNPGTSKQPRTPAMTDDSTSGQAAAQAATAAQTSTPAPTPPQIADAD